MLESLEMGHRKNFRFQHQTASSKWAPFEEFIQYENREYVDVIGRLTNLPLWLKLNFFCELFFFQA